MPTFTVFFYNTISYTNWQISDRKGFYQKLFGLSSLEAYNYNFKMQRIQSTNILVNLGDIFMLLLFFTIVFLVTLALMKLTHNMTGAYRKFLHFRNQFSLDHIMLFLQIIFLSVCLNSLLNLMQPDTGNFPGIMGLVISTLMFSMCLVFMLFFVIFLLKNFKNLKEPKFRKKYLSLYDGLNVETKWSSVANFVWLLRSFIFTILVMTSQDFPKIQASIFFCLSASMQLYVIIQQPFVKTIDTVLQVFNESGIIVFAVSYFFFTDMTFSIKSKTRVGWTCVAGVIIGVIVNSAFILWECWRAFKHRKDPKVDDTSSGAGGSSAAGAGKGAPMTDNFEPLPDNDGSSHSGSGKGSKKRAQKLKQNQDDIGGPDSAGKDDRSLIDESKDEFMTKRRKKKMKKKVNDADGGDDDVSNPGSK